MRVKSRQAQASTAARLVAALIIEELDAEELRETDAILKAFTKRHPDWQQYEHAMLRLAKFVGDPPGRLTELQYLKFLYSEAKYEARQQGRTRGRRRK